MKKWLLKGKGFIVSMFKSVINNYENKASKEVFTIECKDIILREFQVVDVDALCSLTQQPEITEFVTDWCMTREGFINWISNYVIKENEEFLNNIDNIKREILRLGIILKETNEFIGWCCLGPCDELPEPNIEIGYAISKHYRNKGYITQAASGVIEYLFDKSNVETLNAIALTYNTSSNRVIEKCGFKYIGEVKVGDRDFYHYKLSKNKK